MACLFFFFFFFFFFLAPGSSWPTCEISKSVCSSSRGEGGLLFLLSAEGC